MKKIINGLNLLFHKFIKLVDKYIVIPITRLLLKLTGKIDKQSKFLENWLSKTNTLLFLSLFLAIIIFIIIDQRILVFSESSAEILKKQPVKAIYNEEAYVIEGIPSTVDITLIGSKADLYIAKQSPAKDVVVDLSGLKEGTHKVNITYNNVSTTIDYKVNPSVATVIIYPKLSQTKTLTIDVLNKDNLDPKMIIKDVTVDSDKVVIKGADYQLSKVATVKALVDINNLVKQEVGTYTLKDVSLKAYDEEGNVVNVEIVPNKINAVIEIDSPSKELPIKVIPIGEVAFGQAISSIDISETKVTVYGTSESLSKLEYIPVEIDVNDLKQNRQYKLEITKPIGIKHMSVNNVTINVSLENVTDKDIENINIDVRNLNELYTVQGISENDIKVTVNIKGASSVLDNIDADDLTAYINLDGYGEGEFDVEVFVEGTDVKVQYLSKTKKVRVLIKKK